MKSSICQVDSSAGSQAEAGILGLGWPALLSATKWLCNQFLVKSFLGPRMTKLNVIWWNHMKIPWLEIPGAAKHCQFAWLVVVRSVEVTTSNGARVSGKARTGWCRHECKIREIE